ncbi:succinate dehydrogenase [ubiquinone] cytochrome b small subunit, mitochondrial [Aricia agestis]|uniref:succinate dehydrogenase [ubiquinone] cytochrome b small subunit, mitochondrial n=1 Tax=Aricia agestis TaxID=91739 RepID=UPI001C20C154|nr:succinate dehydrogenase [ubiquinone] cytochrome b small subunit, mitochondrial [Aricia agestis]
MALSMFLRAPACTSRLFSQQLRQLSTQTVLNPAVLRSSASAIQLKKVSLVPEAKPILKAVRSFQTSSVRLSGEKAHDHTKLWVIEKVTAAALVPLIPLSLLMPNKLFDSALALLIVAHSFWGLEAIAVDYVRASIFGPIIPKIAIALVYLISIATLGGLLYIITHDIGLANTVKQFWAIKSEQKA